MSLWSYPGVVTNTPHRSTFEATLDLGARLYHPTQIRIAGLRPQTGSRHALHVTRTLPEGTPFQAITHRITNDGPLRAHILLDDGTDVANLIRDRQDPTPTPSFGGTLTKQWTYPARIIHTTDGDTALIRVDLGVNPWWKTTIRIAHVDAPEKRTPEGDAALVWAERVLTPGLDVTVHSHGLDKYRRLLGSITLPDGSDYGAQLVAAGHAKPYEGGAR